MVTSMLGVILGELGKTALFAMQDLHADRNDSCLVRFANGLEVQLELDTAQSHLIAGCVLGAVPEGRYREELFTEALRINSFPPPQWGTFAYSKVTNHFILFGTLNVQDINGEKVAEHLIPLLETAMTWRDAILANQIPPPSSPTGSTSGLGRLFGMK